MLGADQCAALAVSLRALADQFERVSMPQTQRAMRDALDGLYPSRSCVVPHEHGHGVTDDGEPVDLTRVEQAVVAGPARVEQDTLRLLEFQRDVVRAVPVLLDGLRGWDPDRRPVSCPRCGMPFPRGLLRCDNLVDDGDGGRRRCEASEKDRSCSNSNCAVFVAPGQKIIDGRCRDCAGYFKRFGRERIPRDALALGGDVIVDGVFTGEDLENLVGQPLRSGRSMTATQRVERAKAAAAARWGN